jgi:hypothetical protein
MADETVQNQNPTPSGTDPLPPANGATPQNAAEPNAQPNPEPVTQTIPKHRFDEVNNKLKEAEKREQEREAQLKKDNEDRLKKQGEFEKLAQQKEEEANTWKDKYSQSLLNAELREQARALGAVDPSVIITLIDKTGIELLDDGTVKGGKEAVEKLLTEKPYLKGTGAAPTVGSPSNPSGEPTTQTRFKASQLRDVEFYRKNEAEILKSMKLGLIEDDVN